MRIVNPSRVNGCEGCPLARAFHGQEGRELAPKMLTVDDEFVNLTVLNSIKTASLDGSHCSGPKRSISDFGVKGCAGIIRKR